MNNNFFNSVLFLILTLFLVNGSAADSDMWQGSKYDSSIPTISQVLGYQSGERISSHMEMLQYFDALQKAAPDKIKIFEYGRTWENRKLIYAVIGSAENIAGLDKFENSMQQLSDARITSQNRANEIIKTIPASVWLAYGVHGNEISSTDAAMMTAYHLLASDKDKLVDKILSNTLVFLDPLQNPDGRTRFVNRYYETVGMTDSSDRFSAEHNEPWPQGRSNHYLFDMNRDWLALTQPETKGRVKALNKYHPLVVIDLHEMGGDDSYYFAPPAQPLNPYMTKNQLNMITKVGENNARHFDDYGLSYFTREVFDAFYPGYGDSWPVFYGAAASTYEVGSARGMAFSMKNGEILTYKQTIQKHFIASVSTAEAVSENRENMLNGFYQYQRDAIESGEKSKRRFYILPATKDIAGNYRLASLLAEHGVEVKLTDKNFQACGNKYKSGAYIIDSAQPREKFIHTVMSKQVDMDPDFLKQQERRRFDKLDDEIYDVTAWSLPLMFNVEVNTCKSVSNISGHILTDNYKLAGQVVNEDAKVAYLIAWGDMAAGRFLTAALREGINLKTSDKKFQHENGKTYPAGTLIIEIKSNLDGLSQKVKQLAQTTGALVDGVDTSWVIKGPNFGSENVVDMPVPKIAMAWDEPVSSLSAGNTRFVIERQFNYPVTAIRTRNLINADLSKYHILILPSGDYKNSVSEKTILNISNWIHNGGVLLTLGTATSFAADSSVALLDVKKELAYKEKTTDKSSDKKKDKSSVKATLIRDRKEFISAIENNAEKPDSVPGVLVNVETDQNHWLTAGINPNVVAIVTGNEIFTPIKLNSGKNVAWFKNEKELVASGYLWQQNKQQLPYKPYLIHQPLGDGMVISFTQEPAYRAYMDGLNILLMNTIFRSVAHSGKIR